MSHNMRMNRPNRPKLFQRYKNLGGKSNVAAFEVKKDGITVRFTDHAMYRYTNQSAGPEVISKMKSLALAGKGLGTFIGADVEQRALCRVR